MKRTLFFLLVIILLITSCSSPETPLQGEGFVKLVATQPKGLDIVDSGRIDHYEYTALPLFELKNEKLSGATNDWTVLRANEESSELIGPFSQGKWTFELRAISVNGVMLWYGKTDYYINATKSNIIPIELKRAEGKGFIEFRLNVPEYSLNMTTPKVTLDGKEVTLEWTVKGEGTGTIEYYALLSDVSVGWHKVTVRVENAGSSVGEAVAVEVTNGNYVFITGSFDVGRFSNGYLHIDEPMATRGVIKKDGNEITSDELVKKESATYTYTLKSGRDTNEIVWYINGEEAEKGKEFTFTPLESGIYEVSAISRYYAESTLGKEWIEESSSSSITVFVEPEVSLITWDAGTTITRQLLPYDTTITLGSPKRENYVFKNWQVTGALNTTLNEGDKFTTSGPSYNFKAVWSNEPTLYLRADTTLLTLWSDDVIAIGSDSSTTVEATKPLNVVMKWFYLNQERDARYGEVRWFIDGKETFLILDKGNGEYSIPTASELKIEKGAHAVRVEGYNSAISDYRNYNKKAKGNFTITWQ